jgi:hypothetical protein
MLIYGVQNLLLGSAASTNSLSSPCTDGLVKVFQRFPIVGLKMPYTDLTTSSDAAALALCLPY